MPAPASLPKPAVHMSGYSQPTPAVRGHMAALVETGARGLSPGATGATRSPCWTTSQNPPCCSFYFMPSKQPSPFTLRSDIIPSEDERLLLAGCGKSPVPRSHSRPRLKPKPPPFMTRVRSLKRCFQ